MSGSRSRKSPMFLNGLAIEQTVVIPDDFITALASVPKLPIAWLVAGGRGNRAAVLQDFAYQFSALLYEQGAQRVKTPVTRRAADPMFGKAHKADPWGGTNMLIRFIMWSAVRGLGMYAYRGEKRARELNPIWTAKALPTDVRRADPETPQEASTLSRMATLR